MSKFLGVKHLGGELYDMHGREVLIYDHTESAHETPCSDCGTPTTIEVMEKWNTDDRHTWSWCGRCDIGG